MNSSEVSDEELTSRFLRDLLRVGENIPEPESFIACACDNTFSFRIHSKVQDSASMACQSAYFLQRRVFPDNDFVLAVTMRTNELISSRREQQVADLGTCVYTIGLCIREGVPESDCAIS